MTKYRQCKLQKQLKSNTLEQTSWLPEKFAVLGKMVKLKAVDFWDDGWEVVHIGDAVRPEDALPDSHNEIKWHRRNTGDSMRKQ